MTQPMTFPQSTLTQSINTTLSPSLSNPHEISQQLQRIDTLHQQLKLETVRAQDFLLKLRRGELEAQTQAELKQQQQQQQQHQDTNPHQHQQKTPPPTTTTNSSPNITNSSTPTVPRQENLCHCSCPHHSPLSPDLPDHAYRASKSSLPLTLPTRVDEREVRDLEKRVRGLEGRVRGFEGMPPDREMALLEVERLRKELEGLARRREGLFEGLSGDRAVGKAGKQRSIMNASGSGKENAKVSGGGKGAGVGKS